MDYDTLINQSRQNAAIEAEEMNLVALLRPRVFIDGNKWCVLYGDDLMNGVAGFGDSPIRAVCDFNRAWRTPIAQQPADVDDVERKMRSLERHINKNSPAYGYIREALAAQPAACVGCEGKPAPENSPCAVCGQQPAADKIAAAFRYESNGIVGYVDAPIHSINMHDDGVVEVVIDYWPEQLSDGDATRWIKENGND